METFTIIPRQRKKLLSYLLFNLSAIGYLLLLNQCTDKVEISRTYKYMMPVYMSTTELREAVDVPPPRTIQEAGKIYFLNGFLFLNEPGEGIHIIDNRKPENPERISFIKVPGNYDLAAKGNYLYADSFIDLLVFDISDVNNIREVERVENVFPLHNSYGGFPTEEGQIITEWVETEETEILEGNLEPLSAGAYFYRGGLVLDGMGVAEAFSSKGSGGSQQGVGGSMARFTIVNNYMYTIDDYNLQVFDISQEDKPQQSGDLINVGFMIETIFPYEDKLFIGAQNGMYIYDNSDPAKPEHISTYEHITSCDPVVVEGSMAYVTLRNGTACNGFTNQLEVIDIEDPYNPKLVKTYAMDNPHGLGIDDGTLFICEGDFGLKVFDASDHTKIDEKLIAHFDELHAFDVIPLGGVLMLVGNDGLYQYDYTDPANIKLLSKIAAPSL